MEKNIKLDELPEGFIDTVINYYKSLDCKYFVLKIEDLLNSMKKLDYFEFDKILKQYNKYRNKVDFHFVLNRDDYPEFKNSTEFYEFINIILHSTDSEQVINTLSKYSNFNWKEIIQNV